MSGRQGDDRGRLSLLPQLIGSVPARFYLTKLQSRCERCWRSSKLLRVSHLRMHLRSRRVDTSGCLKLCPIHLELDWNGSINCNVYDVNLLLPTAMVSARATLVPFRLQNESELLSWEPRSGGLDFALASVRRNSSTTVDLNTRWVLAIVTTVHHHSVLEWSKDMKRLCHTFGIHPSCLSVGEADDFITTAMQGQFTTRGLSRFSSGIREEEQPRRPSPPTKPPLTANAVCDRCFQKPQSDCKCVTT